MNYEVTNIIDENNPAWDKQKQRLQNGGAQLITLAPNPGLRDDLLRNDIKGFNLIDSITKRTLSFDESDYMFFNNVPTVNGAEVFMNGDFSIDIIADGDIIGHVVLWPNLRRHVKQIQYVYQDGEPDFVEEIASDGKRFSDIIYTRGDIQRIDFFNDNEEPVVRFFFYHGEINYITIGDFRTLTINSHFNSLNDFVATEMGKILTKDDTVGINYMGIELVALSQSNSQNTLFLEEDPLDDDGKVKGNLEAILTNKLPFIQKVVMSQDSLEKIKSTGVPVNKVNLV